MKLPILYVVWDCRECHKAKISSHVPPQQVHDKNWSPMKKEIELRCECGTEMCPTGIAAF